MECVNNHGVDVTPGKAILYWVSHQGDQIAIVKGTPHSIIKDGFLEFEVRSPSGDYLDDPSGDGFVVHADDVFDNAKQAGKAAVRLAKKNRDRIE